MAVDHSDRILVATWGDREAGRGLGQAPVHSANVPRTNFVVAVDRNGSLTESWSQWATIFARPHRIHISPYDPERHVWVVNLGEPRAHEQVVKFTNDAVESYCVSVIRFRSLPEEE